MASVAYRQAFNDTSFGGGDSVANNIAINPNHLHKGNIYSQKEELLPHMIPNGDRHIATYQEQHIKYRNPVHSQLLDSLPKDEPIAKMDWHEAKTFKCETSQFSFTCWFYL